MFQFWLEKFLMRFSFLFAFLAFIYVFYYAYTLEKQNTPLTSNVAPFRESILKVQSDNVLDIKQVPPLSTPQLTSNEIKNWLNTSVSEALTFDGANHQAVMKKVAPYFTPNGFREYQSYLETSGILKTLATGAYSVGLFFDQDPYVGFGTNFQDVYRWQAQMPLSLSFKERRTGRLTNRELDLNIQIRRVDKTVYYRGIQIDSWQAKLARRR